MQVTRGRKNLKTVGKALEDSGSLSPTASATQRVYYSRQSDRTSRVTEILLIIIIPIYSAHTMCKMLHIYVSSHPRISSQPIFKIGT